MSSEKGVDAWQAGFARQFEVLNRGADAAVRSIFLECQRQGVVVTGECVRCRLVLPVRQLRQLHCGHQSCEQCLERGVDSFVEPRPFDGRGSEPGYAQYVNTARRHFYMCARCNGFSVLYRRPPWFNPMICEYPTTVHPPAGCSTTLTVHPAASAALQPFIRVVSYYANERYIMFTRKFAASNLLPVDYRGPCSDELNVQIDPTTLFTLPNSKWFWITSWQVDNTIGDKDGWQYAFNWPNGVVPGEAWSDTMHKTSFVRHRRWRRVMIHFGDALRQEMVQAHLVSD
jgi:hypothetical protein